MSFFDLKGTGELHCDKTKRIVEVDLVIQAVNGRTRIHYSLVDINEPFDLHDFSFTAHNPSLKNVKIESAAGTLSADHLANVHLNYLSSFNENEPLLITQLANMPGKRHTLTLEAGYLTLSSSNLAFDFEPSSERITGFQLMFIGSAQNIKAFRTSIVIGNQIVKIQSYGNTHPSLAGIIVVDAKGKISIEHQEILSLTLELYLRQKVSFLAELSTNKALLNIVDHSTVSFSALNTNASYSLIHIKAFIAKHPESRTYLRFLTEMAGNSGTIDDRLLNGFVALEALFEGKKLQEDKISRRLSISRVTAKFIIELRNTFFHDGRSIKDTLDFLLEQKLKHPQAPIIPLLQALIQREDASWIVYSSFADLMYTHFATLVGLDPETIRQWSEVDLRDDSWFQKLEVQKGQRPFSEP
ncbi:hypothetical protein KF946_12775 [Idiomarina loihiensis]|uniref:hypothetical protein n=1 Tax=Idiomarina TaxID=135575 RepID=UPI000D70C46F|nr:hypothetical protein [Idiomarina]MRJ45691.1 hypothetical protein [Idiomarina loihiensis]PWW38452.1 hypothetical protein DFO83_104152 [Idiomarina loihiensis]TDP48474.1 hypothetical protein DET58_104151 [Idiomarina loihiensis]TDS23640.1 hypothetical protein DET62_104151 [Idiomarina sp. H2]UTW32868.1 hypothetical protein KF946_12775 [Idiomarina loihiensis]